LITTPPAAVIPTERRDHASPSSSDLKLTVEPPQEDNVVNKYLVGLVGLLLSSTFAIAAPAHQDECSVRIVGTVVAGATSYECWAVSAIKCLT